MVGTESTVKIARILTVFLLLVAVFRPALAEPILLIAKAGVNDPYFLHTVVLVTGHAGRGKVGVILNRREVVDFNEVFPEWRDLKIEGGQLFFGGPVDPQMLVFVVRQSDPPENAIPLSDQLYLSFDRELLVGSLNRPQPFQSLRLFHGFAGWAEGQLEREVDRGDWIIVPFDPAVIFDADPDSLWRRMFEKHSGSWVRQGPFRHYRLLLAGGRGE